MPKSSQNDRRERKALLKALGVKIRYEYPPEYHKTECSICLKKIKKGEQLTLQCGHVYHGECLKHWAIKNTNNGECDCHQPVSNRRINLFNQGENIFSCPCCRLEYTHDVYTSEIKKVIAKIHFKNNGYNVVHYITDPMETLNFVPSSNINNDHINQKWGTILAVLKMSWEKGNNDIFGHVRLHPEPEFILQNKNISLPPLDDEKGMPKEPIKDKDLLIYREVEIDELEQLLNDVN
jgi:hypothetical protein